MDPRGPWLSRRAALGAALAAGALAATRSWAAESEVDVVIVGAGAAGIGAALGLHGQGLTYKLIEAESRIGGRAFTDAGTFDIPFDIGCAWIHRALPDNPMLRWAQKLGFETRFHDLGLNHLYYGPKNYDPAIDQAEVDARALHGAIERAAAGGEDVPASSLVGDWAVPMDAAVLETGQMDAAVDLYAASALELGTMPDYDPNRLVRRGYGALVAAVAQALRVPANTLTSRPVTRIAYEGERVAVETADGLVTRARAVIVTVSMGVLRAGAIKFEPGLPASHEAAIHGLQMGLLAKIPLLVRGLRGLAGPIKPYDNILDEEPRPNVMTQFGLKDIYFLAWPWESDLMVGFVGGDFAWDLSLRHDAQREAVAFATERLADLFGSGAPGKVEKGLLTPWATNPFQRGAYSAALPGQYHCRELLRAPVDEKLFFAGEAAAVGGMQATCSGAYLSGLSVADEVARTLLPA